jgi:hypothetical protein
MHSQLINDNLGPKQEYESVPEWDSIRHISLLILYIG